MTEILSVKIDGTNYAIWKFHFQFCLKEKACRVILMALKAYQIAMMLRKSNSAGLMMQRLFLGSWDQLLQTLEFL